MKALIFKATGDFARFRCSYTTTSALTYSVIHPIAVKGLIGAIMGIDYAELFEYTKGMKIAIEVLNPLKKDTQSFNLVPQSGGNGAATFPSRVEFLRDVSYRITVIDDEDKLFQIRDVITTKNFTFTPYLGASEHIAKITFEDIIEAKRLEGTKGKVNSIIPKDKVLIEENSDIKLCIDRIPVKNEKSREYIKYEKIVFAEGTSIIAELSDIYKVGDYNVYFF